MNEKEAIGKVLSKINTMSNEKIVEADKKREKYYTAEDFSKLFKLLFKRNTPISSNLGDDWTYFWAKKPKGCAGCKFYSDKCIWGFKTISDGKKIRPQKGTCCMPFKIRGYKNTDDQIKRHIESVVAHANNLLDSNKDLFGD